MRMINYNPSTREDQVVFVNFMTYLQNGALVSTAQDGPPPFIICNRSNVRFFLLSVLFLSSIVHDIC